VVVVVVSSKLHKNVNQNPPFIVRILYLMAVNGLEKNDGHLKCQIYATGGTFEQLDSKLFFMKFTERKEA